MSSGSATDVLIGEHQVIQRMLDVVRELAHLLEVGAEVPPEMLDSVAEFLRVFGDEHHRKEEQYLFPALGKRGAALDSMAIETFQREHDRARQLLSKMADAGAAYRERRPNADRRWGRFASEYASVLRRHLDKEQDVLYPAAEQLLSAEERRTLAEVLRKTSEERGPQERKRRFTEMADSLAAELLVV
jgi:hemerythrin-like domain-containing protein